MRTVKMGSSFPSNSGENKKQTGEIENTQFRGFLDWKFYSFGVVGITHGLINQAAFVDNKDETLDTSHAVLLQNQMWQDQNGGRVCLI